MGEPFPGRWIPTFATDCRPGDRISLAADDDGRLLVDRDYPDSWVRNLKLTFLDGHVLVGKTARVWIWDVDGSVSQRVQDLSARGIR